MPLPGQTVTDLRLPGKAWILAALLMMGSAAAQAFEAVAAPVLPAQGTLQAVFAPGDDIEAVLLDALGQARQQILVQAYLLTSKPLTHGLIAARQRGVDVRVLMDAGQLNERGHDRIAMLQAAGVTVALETQYKSAHNKVLVIDSATAEATVITGSYNFTWTAQNKNAENILIARRNPPLAAQYAANWARHFQNAQAPDTLR
jgi:phosphatidylserine/phosphatidylglycerophosphate/cardiolipin synthase-like enzyme